MRDARRSLKRAEDEREGLKFTAADEAAVQAAKDKAGAATKAKEAECTVRGHALPGERGQPKAKRSPTLRPSTATRRRRIVPRSSMPKSRHFSEKIEKAGPDT